MGLVRISHCEIRDISMTVHTIRMPSILFQVSRELPLNVVNTYMKCRLLGSRLLQVYLCRVTNLLRTHDC